MDDKHFNSESIEILDVFLDDTKPKKSKLKWIISLGFIFVIGIFITAFFWLNNNGRLILKSFDNLKSEFKSILDFTHVDIPNLGNEYTLQSDLNLLLKGFGSGDAIDLKTDLITKVNLNEKQLLVDFNSDIISLKYFKNKDEQYVLFKDIFTNYVKLDDLAINDDILEVNNEERTYLFNFIVDSLLKELNKEHINYENTDVLINGKEVKTKKITVKINKDNASSILEGVISKIKNNKNAHEIMIKINEDYENLIISDVLSEEEISYSIYTKGLYPEIVKYEAILKTTVENEYNFDDYFSDININNNKKVVEYKFVYTKNNLGTFELFEDNNLELKFTIERNNNSFSLNLIDEFDVNLGKVDVKKIEKGYELEFDFNIDSTSFNGKGTFLSLEKQKNKEYVLDIDLDISIYSNGEMINVVLDSSNNLSSGAVINENTTDSVYFEDLSEEDAYKIFGLLFSLLMFM